MRPVPIIYFLNCELSTNRKASRPAPPCAQSLTRMLENEADISLGVGLTYTSGRVDMPAPILSAISFKSTLGTLSSVALTVRRTI